MVDRLQDQEEEAKAERRMKDRAINDIRIEQPECEESSEVGFRSDLRMRCYSTRT